MTCLVPHVGSPLPVMCSAASGSARSGWSAPVWVDAGVAGLGLPERGDDLAVGVEHAVEFGMGRRSGAVGVAEPEIGERLACGDLFEAVTQLLADREQESLPSVEIVVTAHRFGGQPAAHGAGVPLPHDPAHEFPHHRVRDLGFYATGAAKDADERFVGDQHERRVLGPAAAALAGGLGDEFGEFVDGVVSQDRFDLLETRHTGRALHWSRQSQQMSAAARSSDRSPRRRATSSIRPVCSKTDCPAQAATDRGRTSDFGRQRHQR
jgi:hypothetical protein